MTAEQLFKLSTVRVLTDTPLGNADVLFFHGSYLKNNQSTFCAVYAVPICLLSRAYHLVDDLRIQDHSLIAYMPLGHSRFGTQ